MTKVTIRNATVDDGAAIAGLSAQLGYATSPIQSLDRLQVILDSNDHAVLVACLDDGVVSGWIHVFLAFRVESDPFAEIGGFVVEESLRGSGIGKRLLAAVEEWVRYRRLAKLRVRTQTYRTETHGFYLHLGFTKAKEQLVLDKQLNTNGTNP